MGKIFFFLNCAVALVALTSYVRRYRRLSRGDEFFRNSKEAYDFVEHTSLSVWWIFGLTLIGLLGVNSFWVVAWMLCGGAACFLVERLIVVSGLGTFITAGEHFMQTAAMAQQQEFDQTMQALVGDDVD